jgi:hypothetical protein
VVTDREFLAHLTAARDRLSYLMREASPEQVLELGEVVDGLYRDMRALHDQPKPRG